MDVANVQLKESNVESQLLKKERDETISQLGMMAEYDERMDVFAADEEKLVCLSNDDVFYCSFRNKN